MIPLFVKATTDSLEPFVARIGVSIENMEMDMCLIKKSGENYIFSGSRGLLAISYNGEDSILGDVIRVDPFEGRAERLIRANSNHNTLLITERCDQLCIMCSQPPKKTHTDRFNDFKNACLLAPQGALIGISGGEPTLYKHELFRLIRETYQNRPDIGFHILTNGQHFEGEDEFVLREEPFNNVTWGIPIYSCFSEIHDHIVGKKGAFFRLMDSFIPLLKAGANIEVRTVLMSNNEPQLADLAKFLSCHLGFIRQWSIMQLENIGFAKNKFKDIYFDHSEKFDNIGEAVDIAELFGMSVALFNFATCTVPKSYRHYCLPSISDWKQKFVEECSICREKSRCAGFFEWHPREMIKVSPL